MVSPVAGETEAVPDGQASGRSMYLIGGRRVTVSDLLEAGLIEAGAKLRFKRNRIGAIFHATVTDKGRLRLDDGGEFRSPSGAAMAAAGGRGGWSTKPGCWTPYARSCSIGRFPGWRTGKPRTRCVSASTSA
jgi:hypothetical protein